MGVFYFVRIILSNFDPPTVGISRPRAMFILWQKKNCFQLPLLGKLLPSINAFPVKRGMSDREALRTGLKLLKEGKVLGLFPEGTRNKTGEIGKGLAGAGFFALRSKAHLVPCAIVGPYKPFQRLKVVFGKPIQFDDHGKNKISAEESNRYHYE